MTVYEYIKDEMNKIEMQKKDEMMQKKDEMIEKLSAQNQNKGEERKEESYIYLKIQEYIFKLFIFIN